MEDIDLEEDMLEEDDFVEALEAEEDVPNVREPRKYCNRVDPFQDYNDKEFIQRYRLTKPLVQTLANRMAALGITGPMAGVGQNLSPELTVIFFVFPYKALLTR